MSQTTTKNQKSPNTPPNPNQQKRQPTIDEQVSVLLGAFNRRNNDVAREAENAVLQVISQLVVLKEAYDKLTKEHQDLKDELLKYTKKDVQNNSKNNETPRK